MRHGPADKALLALDDVEADYGGPTVLHGVSLRVEPGEFVAVLGPNGAGKTTLFKVVSGLIQPARGSIRFDGRDLLALPAPRRPHLGIAHVPEGRQVFPSLSVLENLEMGAWSRRGRGRLDENLEKIFTWFPALRGRRRQIAGTLSGGEQQMLAIGRGLAADPRILLLDEPSMGLAPTVAYEIFERLLEIHREAGLCLLLVEQRVAEALQYVDRAYVLEAGRVILSGDRESLRHDDRIRQAYLGM